MPLENNTISNDKICIWKLFSCADLWHGSFVFVRNWCVESSISPRIFVQITIYRVSQEECEILRESVPYVKLYRYSPKHLYPKLNGYGDNGQRSLRLWQLLYTYWLPNTYWNWQEYVVSVMLISVLNIKELVSDIKPLNWTTKTLALMPQLSLGFQALYIALAYLAAIKYCLIALGGARAP